MPFAILGGAGLAFFALIGFEDSVNMAEEAENPRATTRARSSAGCSSLGHLPRRHALASMVVPTDTLAAPTGPLLEVVQVGPLGVPTEVFSAIALFALANGALINMIMASRIVYGMAREGIIPAAFWAVASPAARPARRSCSRRSLAYRPHRLPATSSTSPT